MNRLETGMLAVLWYHILHRFHGSSQILQSAEQDLNSAVEIYLLWILSETADQIRRVRKPRKGTYSECDHYKEEVQRVCRRNRRYDDPEAAPEQLQTPVDN